jgi:hypothetical protein
MVFNKLLEKYFETEISAYDIATSFSNLCSTLLVVQPSPAAPASLRRNRARAARDSASLAQAGRASAVSPSLCPRYASGVKNHQSAAQRPSVCSLQFSKHPNSARRRVVARKEPIFTKSLFRVHGSKHQQKPMSYGSSTKSCARVESWQDDS